MTIMKVIATKISSLPNRELNRESNIRWLYFCHLFWLLATANVTFGQTSDRHGDFLGADLQADPIAFSSSYVGFLLNQNHPWSYGSETWSKGGPSWGMEYRFFYKDKWTLAISGSFKQLEDKLGQDAPFFALSQQTMRMLRVYHPWYLAVGGGISSFIPVRKIMLPYERDQTRALDTGAAIGVASIFIASPKLVIMVSANRWRSLSTSKKQGLEIATTALLSFR